MWCPYAHVFVGLWGPLRAVSPRRFPGGEPGWDQVTPFARGAPGGRCGASAPRLSLTSVGTYSTPRSVSVRSSRPSPSRSIYVPSLLGLRPAAERPVCAPSAAKTPCFGPAAAPASARVAVVSPRQQKSEGLSPSVKLRSVGCWPLAKDFTRFSGLGPSRHPSTLSAWSGRGIPLSGCAYRSSAVAFTGRASLRRGPHPGELSGGNWMVLGAAPSLERSVWDRAWMRPRLNLN